MLWGHPSASSPRLSCCLLPTSVISPSGPCVHLPLLCLPLLPGRGCPRGPAVCQAPLRGGVDRLCFLPPLAHIVGVDKGNGVLVSRCDPTRHIHQAPLSPSFFFSPSHFRFGLWRGNSNCEKATCQDKNHSARQCCCPGPRQPSQVPGGSAKGHRPRWRWSCPAWLAIPASSWLCLLMALCLFPHRSNGDNNSCITGLERLEGRIQRVPSCKVPGAVPGEE